MNLFWKVSKSLQQENIQLKQEIFKLKEEKKEMVELLGRVYIDVDHSDGYIYNDTRKLLDNWVGGK